MAGTLNTRSTPARLVRCLYPDLGSLRVYGFEVLCEAVLPLALLDRARQGSYRGDGSSRVVRLVRSSGADANDRRARGCDPHRADR